MVLNCIASHSLGKCTHKLVSKAQKINTITVDYVIQETCFVKSLENMQAGHKL